jgi:N-acetylated-alpha-linked acidic dipeptidase
MAKCAAPLKLVMAAVLALGTGAIVQPSAAADPRFAYPLADRLAAGVTERTVSPHLRALQRIADDSGGDRAYNRIGGTRSIAYAADLLKRAGYTVVRQPVPYTDFDIERESLTVGGGGGEQHVRALMTRFTPSTSPEGITSRLVSLPDGRTGCDPADYSGVNAGNAVVVLARADCGYTQQQQVAAGVKARAVLMYYRTPSPQNIYRFIAFTPSDFTIPMASVSQRDGERLVQAAAGGGATVHLTLRSKVVSRTTVNLIAETSGGDPDDTVLLGAHLDSVTEGPGLNDNGSTAAAVLQTALRLAPEQRSVRNKVRFVWWGAEELGDIGSEYYVAHLSGSERARIAAVLNGELIGSPNPGRFVWDPGSGGGHVIADLFGAYFARRGLPYERTSPQSIGSDHLPFDAIGIPVGGLDGGSLGVKTPEQQQLFGGRAGQMFDPCYHQACDNMGNLDRQAVGANAQALAWVLGRLATYNDDVRTAPGRTR